MAQITIESEALDSLKAMAQRLQDERNELLKALQLFEKWGQNDGRTFRISAGTDSELVYRMQTAIAKCTSKPEVLE